MAKLGKMPQKEIIDGFKGLIDFYYWKGIPVARSWPRYFPRTPSPAEATTQTAFAYINRLWSDLPLLIKVQLTQFAARSTLTGKDFLVRGYMKGLYDLMPLPILDHDHTEPGDGGQLTATIVDTFMTFLEQAAAAPNPPANSARLYAREDAGVTKLYYKQDDGTEIEIGAPTPGLDISARAYHDAIQAIPHNTWTPAALNSERWDTDAIHDNVTNNTRLTCKTAGKYQITAHAGWAANASGERYIAIYLNGTTFIGISIVRASLADMTFMSISTLYNLGVGDYVEMYVKQTRGAPLNLMNWSAYCAELAMAKVLG